MFSFSLVILLTGVSGEDCPQVCPALYGPTCGFNGECHIQFDNECQMRALNCNPKYSGASKFYYKIAFSFPFHCFVSEFSELKGPQICPGDKKKCDIDIYNL